jgi:hypothetical protein
MASSKSVVFIDPSIAEYQKLINYVEPGTLLFILDPKQEGIRQITNELAKLTNIASLQIISPSTEGSLQLGSTFLNNIKSYSSQLQQWSKSLTTTGEILLYGYDVAQELIGKTFVQHSQFTDANVTTSDDWTNHPVLDED